MSQKIQDAINTVKRSGNNCDLNPSAPQIQTVFIRCPTMPKVSKVGRFRATVHASKPIPPLHARLKKGVNKIGNDGNPSEPILSSGQLKRRAKREKYLRRKEMVLSSLRLRKLEEQKGQLDGLDALRDALPTSKSIRAAKEAAAVSGISEAPPSPSEQLETSSSVIGSNRAKKNLAGREITHMNLVLEHPSFQENPFDAITIHLRNTLASQGEAQLQESMKQTKKNDEAEKLKKEMKKARLKDAKYNASRKGGSRTKNIGGNKSGRAAKR